MPVVNSNPSDPTWGNEDERPLHKRYASEGDSSIDGPGHADLRSTLQVIGPGIVLVGILFTAIGFISIFSTFGTFGPPRYFWCAFIGIPLIGLGSGICRFAFMGAVTRYVADEVAPVGKDVINYMADGTQDAVRTIAAAVTDGIRTGITPEDPSAVHCTSCHSENDAEANFCKSCGRPLQHAKPCPGCGEQNDADAQFCDHCGKKL